MERDRNASDTLEGFEPGISCAERLVDLSVDMLCVATMDGYFKIMNPAFERTLGYSLEELRQKPFIEFVHPDDRPATLAEMEKLRRGVTTLYFENRYLCKNGTYKWLAWTSRPDLKGKLLYAVAREMTERKREMVALKESRQELQGLVEETGEELKQKEEQLRQAQKLESVGRLAGGVAHEFNNMLMIIIGFSDRALNHGDSPAEVRRCLSEIKKAGERSATLTRQLLAFGRKQVLQREHANLNNVVSGVEKMLQRVIREDIEIVAHLSPDLAFVLVDPSQIEQVLLNLAINAQDAMPGSGKLTIETSNVELDVASVRRHPQIPPGEYVLLTVSDTGIGMDERTLSHVFEPFFTTKPRGEGSGLGLAMVYGIVKQSGGHICAYSEAGKGTSFEIYFPRVKERVVEAGTRTVPRASGGSESVLLVEDETMVRDLVVTVLGDAGYTVIAASSPKEALDLMGARGKPVHLLITDVVMPGMSGPKLAEQLVASCPEIKVIYMSGYAAGAVVENGFLVPGTVFLQKPFDPETLKDKVREILDAPRGE